MKATSHAMSKMILTLTSVAHYQLFLFLSKFEEICVYNRSVIRFMPCGTNQIKGHVVRGSTVYRN